MRILYGVQTTGHGHIVRARTIIDKLRALGHEIDTLFSGPPKTSWETEPFQPYVVRRGLTFVTDHGRLRVFKTAMQVNLVRFIRDIFGHKPTDYDLVITDYEPITSRVARLRGIPCVGVGHLYAYAFDAPIYGRNPFNCWIMKNFAPAKYPLGLHWHHFDQPILPPTIPPDVVPAERVVDNKILVYMSFENVEAVKAYLRGFGDHEFFIYCKVDAPSDEDNLRLRPFSREGFVRDLGECSGVIANAGFSLASEALHLGKKLLLKPVRGQTEQESNALALRELDLGEVIHRLDPEAARRWLARPPIEPMNYPNVMDRAIEWIDRGRWDTYPELARSLWARPETAASRPAR